MRTLYTWLLYAALPWVLARLWWRGRREPGYREALAERFGFSTLEPKPKLLWLHAVSVGEARACAPLVRALQREYPDHELLVTCLTASGRETVKQVFGESVLLAYLPYDYPRAVRRFLEHFRPRLGVLVETEIWPNLVQACRQYGVPVVLANARMSHRSARGYRRLGWLSQPAFASLAAVCAQGAADARRLTRLGAREVTIAGNLKFDIEPDAAKVAEGRAFRAALGQRKVLLFASTREGEEERLLEEAGDTDDSTLLVLVPRHQQRFDAVASLAERMGFTVARRSLGEAPHQGRRSCLYLGDTMGEMAFYYALCDVAVIGGSFEPLGGQNLIEGCAAGVPVITGPHMFNFADVTRLAVRAQAALQLPDAAAALRVARDLLADPERCARMGVAARRLCARHRGAAERHLAVCRRLLTGQGRG
ncbi:MAG: lipid IV(A) 3-deoxy-D-manno-octulosonic acid transferase [Betaproteobacteria bacterium]|nr:lipid IV(A) 3-deoxy-D-manno-octulosonic acid transferase [Betaproteobacteria bacterium]